MRTALTFLVLASIALVLTGAGWNPICPRVPAPADAGSPSVPIAFQQEIDNGTPGAVTNVTVTFGSATKAHGLIVVAVNYPNATLPSSIVDTGGDTFHHINDDGGVYAIALYYAWNTAASATESITVTFPGAANTNKVAAYEFSGALSASDPLDARNGTSFGAGGSMTSGNMVCSVSGELVIGYATSNGGGTTPGTGFTQASLQATWIGEYMLGASGTVAATANAAGATSYSMLGATFKPS